MEAVRPILALVHVGAALLYVTGYVSTNTLTELARRAGDIETRRSHLTLSGRFDLLYQIPFGTLVGLSGLAVTAANGYSFGELWIALSSGLFAVVVVIGAGVWRRRSGRVRDALAAGDDAGVMALLDGPRYRLLTWFERLLVAVVVALMVLRPA